MKETRRDLWEVLEQIGELTIKLEGVAATAFTVEEHMHNKNYSPTINLLGLIVTEVKDELESLVAEAHDMNKEIKLEKVK